MIFYTVVNDKDTKKSSDASAPHVCTHTHRHTHKCHTLGQAHSYAHTLAHARILARVHTQYIYCVCIDIVSKVHYQLRTKGLRYEACGE